MKNEKQYIFDNPKNVKRLLYVFYGICIFLFGLDFVIDRHIYHSWENMWGFYPVYGFIGSVCLVLVSTWMRKFLMRPEDYYESGKEENKLKTGAQDVDA